MVFPPELKKLFFPKIIQSEDEIIIWNRPFTDDITFSFIFPLGLFITITSSEGEFFVSEIVISSLLTLLFLWIIYSLDKVRINFKDKTISRKSYNPLINIIRKSIFKYPATISFKNIAGFETDYIYSRKSMTKYIVILHTDDPYKFKIAIFTQRDYSNMFADYLRFKIGKQKASFDDE